MIGSIANKSKYLILIKGYVSVLRSMEFKDIQNPERNKMMIFVRRMYQPIGFALNEPVAHIAPTKSL